MANQRSGLRRKQTEYGELFIKGGFFDYQTVFLTILITGFGIMMVYSASSYRAVMNGLPGYYFALRQGIFGVAGIFAMLVVSRINYKYYQALSMFAIYLSLALLVFVLVAGQASHGAVRWINLGFIQFQPSEIAKPAIIIYMAHVCVAQSKRLSSLKGTIQVSILPIICIGLIATENLSTAIICFGIYAVIVFVASPKFRYLLLICVAGVFAAVLLIAFTGYRGDRIEAWLHPETSDKAYQTIQSLYAIGSGGIFGRGLGESIQKLGFLPESHNDMIFSVICEELGLVGAVGVLAIFIMLLIRFRYIANNAADSFGGLLVTGVITHISVQLIVNVGVITNTIPPTGVTLPFISYGGTSLFLLLIEVGMVLGVSRQIRPVEKAEAAGAGR